MVIAFIIPFFIWINASSASPLGKVIEVCITCAETGATIPDGLAVTLTNGVTWTHYTVDGCVEFGSGIEDGTYIISFYWNEPFSYTVTIDCSQIVWHFDYTVPNPVIIKHFYYALTPDIPDDHPIVGLEVILKGPALTDSYIGTTDASGTVTFGGDIVEVCKVYELRYTWGGVLHTIGPIHFEYDTNGQLQVCVWEETNYLEPKSGGGFKKLYLVEE
jgi:hypothetical protein